MWGKIFKAVILVVKYAPAIVEAVKAARERHPESAKEELKG